MSQTSSNTFIEHNLHSSLAELEKHLKSDVLTYIGPIREPLDSFVRDAIEAKPKRRSSAAIILETNGGYIETAERIANTIRHHYGRVEFIIPNHAFSAGTVLVMSGDRIWMDYFSVLGPIDPQISIGGRMVPALGYERKYKELIDKSHSGTLSTAEIAYLIDKFDPAEIYQFEEARKLSIDLLQDWLVRYKFRDWKETRGKKTKVTMRLRKDRAKAVAEKLGEHSHWHSHARGLSMQVLDKDVGLIVDDFRGDQALFGHIDAYYRLLKDYMMRRGHQIVIHMGDVYSAA